MSVAIKHTTKEYFNDWAHSYDKSILQHLVFRASHKMFSNRITNIHNEKNDIKILDVGCGTGEFISNLGPQFKEAEFYGVDLSSDMIKIAKSKLERNGVSLKVGDVENLPYEDNSFDIITCSHSFHHYPNKDKAAREMHRVLKKGGRVMIVDGCRDVPFGRVIFDIVTLLEKHVYHLFAHEFENIFSEAGFHEIDQKRFNFVPLLLTSGVAKK